MPKYELHFTQESTSLIICDLTSTDLELPSFIGEITALNDEGVVPVSKDEVLSTVITSSEKIENVRIISINQSNVIFESDNKKVILNNVGAIISPSKSMWKLESYENTIIRCYLNRINKYFRYSVGIKDRKINFFTLRANIVNDEQPFAIDKLIFKTNEEIVDSAVFQSSVSNRVNFSIDRVINRGECDDILQAKCDELVAKSKTLASATTVERAQNDIITFNIEKYLIVKPNMVIPLWNKRNLDQRQVYFYYRQTQDIKYGFVLNFKEMFTPNGSVEVFNENNTLLTTINYMNRDYLIIDKTNDVSYVYTKTMFKGTHTFISKITETVDLYVFERYNTTNPTIYKLNYGSNELNI